jgi:hypothetical protein
MSQLTEAAASEFNWTDDMSTATPPAIGPSRAVAPVLWASSTTQSFQRSADPIDRTLSPIDAVDSVETTATVEACGASWWDVGATSLVESSVASLARLLAAALTGTPSSAIVESAAVA